MCTRRTAPSVASPLLHGIKRSAFTQERERFGCARSVARYIYRSTWEHARAQYIIRFELFERSSYGEPQQLQIPPKAPFNEFL